MDDENYRLIDGDDSKKNNGTPNKDSAYLINDCSTTNRTNDDIQSSRNSSNPVITVSDFINNIVNSFDSNNNSTKIIIGVLLFHPILNLIIQDNPNVRKVFTKSQRKLIKKIMIVFMLFCLIGFSVSNSPGEGTFISFFLKSLLIIFLLIHTNICNFTDFDATIKFWKKIFSKKDK